MCNSLFSDDIAIIIYISVLAVLERNFLTYMYLYNVFHNFTQSKFFVRITLINFDINIKKLSYLPSKSRYFCKKTSVVFND